MVQKSCGHQLRLVDNPIIYKVLYIWDGAGFLPSTLRTWNTGVGKTFFHLGRPIFRCICQFLGVSNRKNAFVGNSAVDGSEIQLTSWGWLFYPIIYMAV